MAEKSTSSELLQLADTLLKSQQYSDALPLLQSVLILDPNNALAWTAKGDALESLEKNQESLDAYDKAISINPNLASAWSGKGCALCKLGKYQDTLDVCNRALSIDPNVREGWTRKGCALIKLGRYQEALDASNRALSIDPDDAKSKENRDAALKNLEHFTKSPSRSTVSNSRPKIKNDYWKYMGYFLGICAIILLFHPGFNNQTTTSQSTLQPTPATDQNPLTPAIDDTTSTPLPTLTTASTTNVMKNEAMATSQAIDYANPVVKNFANSHVKSINGGAYDQIGVNQISDIWDSIRPPYWTYVSDPANFDSYTSASDTITSGLKGNCEDFAILNAALVEAIGGSSRVITACSPDGSSCHAYAEAYITNDYSSLQSTTNYLRDRYGVTPVYYHSYLDPSGNTEYWLNLDWQANNPGGPFFQDDGIYKIFYPDGTYDVITNSGSTIVTQTPSMQYLTESTTDVVPTSTIPLLYAPTPTPALLHETVCTKLLNGEEVCN